MCNTVASLFPLFSMQLAADNSDTDLEIALALSQAMAQEDDQRRAQEEEELQRVLRLSLEEQ